MKHLKKLLVLAFCFAFMMTTTVVTNEYSVNPYGNHFEDILPLEN